jgi:DNA-binding transcriptional regulator YhcF (GntR family)
VLHLTIDKQSPIPWHEQIKDQVRLALAIGDLKPGDYVPSIRQVDSRLKVGLATIRRAYEDLARSGLLTLERGRGAFVSKGAANLGDGVAIAEYEKFFATVHSGMQKRRLVPSAFARFFFSRTLLSEQENPSIAVVEESATLAEDYVQQLRHAWQLPIAALSLPVLSAMPAEKRKTMRCLLSDYYVIGLMKGLLRGQQVTMIPLEVEFGPEMNTDLGTLPRRSSVAVVLADSEHEHKVHFIRELFEKSYRNNQLRFQIIRHSEADLPALLADRKLARVYVGNLIWDALEPSTKASPRIRRPRLRITDACVKRAWTQIGVI